MRPITFNRLIVLKEHVVSVKDVYIEDDLNYSIENSELTCKGNIKIKFNVNYELEVKAYEEKIDVEVVLSLAKIDCEQDLKLQFKDYIVNIDDHLIKFIIRYELLGNGEKIIAFKEVADSHVENDLMLALLRKDKDVESFVETSSMVEDLIDSKDVEVIGAEDLVPLTSESVSIDETIREDEDIKEGATEIRREDNLEVSVEEKHQPLFKEKFDISYFFYKVPDEKTSYEDLAKKFNVDLNRLKKDNLDSPLYKGKLIKINK